MRVLKQSIEYLERCNLIRNNSLYLYLSSRVAPCEKIVDFLTVDQISSIYKYRDNSKTQIEIRNSAMLLVGLRLGFRASDVINLRFSNIDWYEKTVSIIQEKTRKSIVMPLPIDVGNTLYNYIRYARN